MVAGKRMTGKNLDASKLIAAAWMRENWFSLAHILAKACWTWRGASSGKFARIKISTADKGKFSFLQANGR
jgi:hypothetical protein